MSEDDLPTILMQKAKGVRNSCGDEWGDCICAEAAARIEAQAALIAAMTEALRKIEKHDVPVIGEGRLCDHGRSSDENCHGCTSAFARSTIARAEEAQK